MLLESDSIAMANSKFRALMTEAVPLIVPVQPGKEHHNSRKIDDFESKWLQVRTNWLPLARVSFGGATRSGWTSKRRRFVRTRSTWQEYSANQQTTVNRGFRAPTKTRIPSRPELGSRRRW